MPPLSHRTGIQLFRYMFEPAIQIFFNQPHEGSSWAIQKELQELMNEELY